MFNWRLAAAVLGMASLFPAGCRMAEPMGAQRDPAALGRETPRPEAGSAPRRDGGTELVSERALSDRGLVTLWTKSNSEGTFRNAYLLPEGIFAVTRPQAGGRSAMLVRYKLEDGLPLWYYPLDEPLEYPPVAYHYRPSPDGPRSDELFILQKDVVRCLDLQHGAELWRVQLPFPVSCGPVVDENQYYIGSYDRRIYAMPKKRALVEWHFITGGEIKSNGDIGDAGQLFFTSTDKSVYRLDPSRGWTRGQAWQFATGGRILGSPVFFSRWTFAGSTDFKLYCLEQDGSKAWDFPVESAILDTPVVMSFRPDKPLALCISHDDRRGEEKRILWCIDAKNGKEMWRREHVAQVVGIGRRAVYLLPEARAGRADGPKPSVIEAVDALKGEELFSLPVDSADWIPLNDAEHGVNARSRGVMYLISKSGRMHAIREKP